MQSSTLTQQQLKQPAALYHLSFFEAWERFGFYCVQALMVLFLTKSQHMSDTSSYALFSAYSALIYATPVIGGYIADRLIGYRRAVITGAVMYFIGYCTLATTSHILFFPALALLICGNGFFKGCVSSLLGTLYEGENDPRRDSGFTLFYMCFNIGSFLAPIVCTWAATKFGWGYGFAAAALGMLIGLSSAPAGFKKLGKHGLPPIPKKLTERFLFGLSRQNLFFVGLIIAIGLITWAINYAKLVNMGFIIFSIATALFAVGYSFRYEPEQRNKMLLMLVLMVFAIFFWMLFLQMFSSVTLFTDRVVDRHFGNHIIPASVYVSIEPFFIMVLSPLLATLWVRLHGHRLNPVLPRKFAFGILFLAAMFLTLSLGIHLAAANGQVWQGWVIIGYFFLTLGELFLYPIGLSMITALAPKNLTGMLMGVWFLTIAIGFAAGDHVANMASVPDSVTDIHAMGAIYNHVFGLFGWIALAISMLLLLLTPQLKRLMGETSAPQNPAKVGKGSKRSQH